MTNSTSTQLREIISAEQLDQFIFACHKADQAGLLRFSSGNMSWRFASDHVALSASRSWLGDMGRRDVAICRLPDGAVLNDRKPSVESRFHLGILQARQDVEVVLHFQSPYATAVACSNRRDFNFNMLPEIPYYIGQIGWVDFFAPGSEELSNHTVEAMTQHDMVLLQNHGLVTAGRTFDETIQKAGFFELACQIIMTNPDHQPIAADKVAEIVTIAQESGVRTIFERQ